jgi:hypothetical protein
MGLNEDTGKEIEYAKGADGNFILGPDGNKVKTKKQRQKDADEARRAKRAIAFAIVLANAKKFLESGLIDVAEDAQALKQALFDLKPMRSTEATVRTTVQKMLSELFGDRKVISGYDAYQAFKAGTVASPDLRKYITLAIKTGKPDDRLWIEYDAKNDNYNLVARGADAPLGWMGYTPVDVAK